MYSILIFFYLVIFMQLGKGVKIHLKKYISNPLILRIVKFCSVSQVKYNNIEDIIIISRKQFAVNMQKSGNSYFNLLLPLITLSLISS